MNEFKHVFFDLDDTLWDFRKNSRETLLLLYDRFQLAKHGVSVQKLVGEFHVLNENLWVQLGNGQIQKKELRQKRFPILFKKLGIEEDGLAELFSKEYIKTCPTVGYLIEGAANILDYMNQNYHVHVITNGFDEIAHQKIHHSGIQKFIKEVITSEK